MVLPRLHRAVDGHNRHQYHAALSDRLRRVPPVVLLHLVDHNHDGLRHRRRQPLADALEVDNNVSDFPRSDGRQYGRRLQGRAIAPAREGSKEGVPASRPPAKYPSGEDGRQDRRPQHDAQHLCVPRRVHGDFRHQLHSGFDRRKGLCDELHLSRGYPQQHGPGSRRRRPRRQLHVLFAFREVRAVVRHARGQT